MSSPYSYIDRLIGGAGSFMSAVDSVAAHGKLWINEDDTRTHLIQLPDSSFLFTPRTKSMHETLGFLERNFGSVLVHRAGTWWMDLVSKGAFSHPQLWDMLQQRMALYDAVYREPKPYHPEVAVLADERSKLYVKSDWHANSWLMHTMRDEIVKSGASVGFYTLDDFVADIVPRCRAYVFANAFHLSDEQIERHPISPGQGAHHRHLGLCSRFPGGPRA